MLPQTGYLQPSDFPQYHQGIKDHAANRDKLLAAVAHHKQRVWEDELSVTLEYREHHERWRNYYYSNASVLQILRIVIFRALSTAT